MPILVDLILVACCELSYDLTLIDIMMGSEYIQEARYAAYHAWAHFWRVFFMISVSNATSNDAQ
jgi:hypothetical protein